MRIYICMKHVPDTAANIRLTGDRGYDTAVLKFVVNPYDEYAVEEAVALVEKAGQGEVVAVCVGPQKAADTMRGALAMGVHRGILVRTDDVFLDSRTTAKALAAAIASDGSPDLVLTGKCAVDTEGSQTPYRLAAALDLPVVSEVSGLEIEGRLVAAQREIGGGIRETLELELPCVIGATKGLNDPRYPKFPDIMKAKKKPIFQTDLAGLGIGTESDALVSLTPAPERSGATIFGGSVRESVEELVTVLEELKIL